MLNLTKALELTLKIKDGRAEAAFELENLIKEAVAEAAAKSKNQHDAYKTLKKIIAQNIKYKPHQKYTHGAWIDNNKQYVVCSHCAIELDEPIEGLPQLASDVTPFKAGQVIDDCIDSCTEEIMPDIPALKAQLKEAQAEARAKGIKLKDEPKHAIQLQQSLYPVDQMLDIISVLGPDTKMHASTQPAKPCLFVSERGRAILMPYRKV